MNREIRDEWTRRLRSGDYQQGAGRLRRDLSDDETEFCCLGVLCEVARDAGVVYLVPNGRHLAYREVDGDDEGLFTGSLPGAVVDWTDLSTNPDARDPVVKHQTLSTWNDGSGGVVRRNFMEIADLIEEYL